MGEPEDIVRRRQQQPNEEAVAKAVFIAARDAELLAKVQWLIPIAIKDQAERNYPNLHANLIPWCGQEQAVFPLLNTVSPGESFSHDFDVVVYLLLNGTMIVTSDNHQTYRVYDTTFERGAPKHPPCYSDYMAIIKQLRAYISPKVLAKAERKARKRW